MAALGQQAIYGHNFRVATNILKKQTPFLDDCNNDGRIDCADYAAIHRLGGYGCQGQVDLKFGQTFRACQAQVQSLAAPTIDVRGGNAADIFKK
ncbi:unnamed protein product [Nezara viridula]|uniref:lysozyme n=1 Tax=Nezara viridula TaxID=85310 RepID=A0A9P0MX22_NEZVI|nr:unnamed protein product [Nezara viridula]